MWVNGRRHSLLPFGGLHTRARRGPRHRASHPAGEIAVVGLGSGDTAWAAGSRGADATHVTVFDYCAPGAAAALAGRRHPRSAAPPPSAFLADPRMLLRVADGRDALQRGMAAYDVIEMDALYRQQPLLGRPSARRSSSATPPHVSRPRRHPLHLVTPAARAGHGAEDVTVHPGPVGGPGSPGQRGPLRTALRSSGKPPGSRTQTYKPISAPSPWRAWRTRSPRPASCASAAGSAPTSTPTSTPAASSTPPTNAHDPARRSAREASFGGSRVCQHVDKQGEPEHVPIAVAIKRDERRAGSDKAWAVLCGKRLIVAREVVVAVNQDARGFVQDELAQAGHRNIRRAQVDGPLRVQPREAAARCARRARSSPAPCSCAELPPRTPRCDRQCRAASSATFGIRACRCAGFRRGVPLTPQGRAGRQSQT